MKKTITLLLLSFIFLTGCSSSSSGSDDNLYFNISVDGVQYNEGSLWGTGFSGQDNCAQNGILFSQLVGQVENASLFIDCNFYHFENVVDFENPQKNILANATVTDINSLYGLFEGVNCDVNNELSINFEDKVNNVYLKFKPNTPKTHTITNLTYVSEDAEAKQYIIEGTFSATFKKGNNDVPVNGNYRIKVDVLK
jgi:hypothetical protein